MRQPARRRLLAAGLGLAAAAPGLAARAGRVEDEALKSASGPGWAAWHGATPPLALPDLDGRPRALGEFLGQVVIVDFWATWCDPCREEIPAMSALARRHEGLRLLAVNNGDSRPKIDAFLAQWPVAGTVLADRNGNSPRDWRVLGMPANYLLDRKGRVRWWHLGLLDWSRPEVLAPVLALLAEG